MEENFIQLKNSTTTTTTTAATKVRNTWNYLQLVKQFHTALANKQYKEEKKKNKKTKIIR